MQPQTPSATIDTDKLDKNDHLHNDDKALSHFIVGTFLCAFGMAFLGMTVVRLRRLLIRMTSSSSALGVCDLLQKFHNEHVPERSETVLRVTSKSILGSTLFGLLYTMLGARFLNHDLHPDYTMFHYMTHITVLLLFFFVGWTGLLETKGYLPADSLRASLAVALWGETLLWMEHGKSKEDAVDGILHLYLGLISGLSAVSATLSVLLATKTTQEGFLVEADSDTEFHSSNNNNSVSVPSMSSPLLSFLLYVGVMVGLVWEGLWFFVIAFHLRLHPILSTGHATALLVLQALLLLVVCQLVAISMVRFYRQGKRDYRLLSAKEYEPEIESPSRKDDGETML